LSRRERYALATKEAIVAAARTLFAERGFFATTVEDLAAAAEVSPATVYSSTGGKQGLLDLLLEAWGSDPTIQNTLDRVESAANGREVIDVLARAACEMREEWDDVVGIFLTTAPHDAAIAAQYAPFDAFYRECVTTIAARLSDLKALRRGADAQYAAEILWLYFGYGSISTLHHDSGWTYDRIGPWLADQASRELLRQERS
jgi:AcrR family transcriptional regulator